MLPQSLYEDSLALQIPFTRNKLLQRQAAVAGDLYPLLCHGTGAGIPVYSKALRGKQERRHGVDPLARSSRVLHIDTRDSIAFEPLQCNQSP